MADGLVQVAQDGTGKKIDTDELAVGANTVERQRVRLAGGAAAELGDVRNATPGSTDYGVVTRNIPSGTQAVTLAAGATNIAKAEDAASADGDVGVPALAVRKATPANTSGADGDYEFLQISAGRLWCSATITDGTNTLPSMDVAARKGFVALTDGTNTAAVKAASTAAVAADPAAVVSLSPNSPLPAGTAVVGKFAPARLSDGFEPTLSNFASDGISASGFAGYYGGAMSYLYNGTTWDRVRGDTTSGADVDVTRLPRNIPLVVGSSGSLGVTTAATWHAMTIHAVPSSNVFKPHHARCAVTTAGTRTLILAGRRLATWNPGTNAFVADGSVSGNDWYDRLFYRVVTTHSATATTVTGTYTNQAGTGSKSTGGLVIPASAPAGDMFEFVLASGDYGVQAVTGASDTANPTSVVDEIWGFRTLLEDLGPANTPALIAFGDGLGVPNPESLFILFNAAATTAQQRFAQIVGDIVAA